MTVNAKKLPLLTAVLAVVVSPLLFSLPVHAEVKGPGTLTCFGQVVDLNQQPVCDMYIDEAVSINPGNSIEAETANQAVSAKVGDTITWTVTVDSDSSAGIMPDGEVTVTDALPTQVGLVSATESTNDGSYSNDQWTFAIGDQIPATLTIVAKVNAAGLFTNTATLSGYSCGNVCLDPPYVDDNAANNVANGYVNVAAPVVMAKAAVVTSVPKAPNTGFGVSDRNGLLDLAAGLLAALPFASVSYKLRKTARQ